MILNEKISTGNQPALGFACYGGLSELRNQKSFMFISRLKDARTHGIHLLQKLVMRD